MSIRLIVASAVLGVMASACQTTPEQGDVIQLTAEDYYSRGVAAFDRGDYDTAQLDLEQALSLNRDYGPAYCRLGEVREKLNRSDLAIDAYEDCLDLQPMNGRAHGRIGALYIAEKQYGKAQAHLEKAIDYSPTDTMAHYNLAEIYRKQGKCGQPVKLYKKALSLQPSLVDAQEGLRRTRKENCKAARPKIQKESEFTGGGKALKPSEW